ncbi:MAG: hypothetical protein KHZ30_18885, partial [Clostridiales bacterium]|nr:hypothetical protein [Clostridiales bacterium]
LIFFHNMCNKAQIALYENIFSFLAAPFVFLKIILLFFGSQGLKKCFQAALPQRDLIIVYEQIRQIVLFPLI